MKIEKHDSTRRCIWTAAITLLLTSYHPLYAGVSPLVFTDITAQAGVGVPNTLTESVAWGDYDNDGDEDLYLTSNGSNNLFRNDGGGNFTDVTSIAGVEHPTFSVGAAFGDLDNDGDLDLYVVAFGDQDALFRNDGPIGPGGQYVFTDIASSAGITESSTTRGMVLFDYDNDGLLDIFVNSFSPAILWHNLGNLTFENVAASLGVVSANVGSVATDINNDGLIDLFTGNRSGAINRLYQNGGGTLTDIAVSAGINQTGLGMGVLSFDYDNDLDMDLYWTVWPGGGPPQPNAFYENTGASTFSNVTGASGTADPLGWGISCNAGDVDNDGWEDFFVTNGFDPSSSPNVLFRNNANKTFTDATAAIGGGAFDGRGVAFADFDNDGDLDLVVTADIDHNTTLWRNDTNNGNAWVAFRLVGSTSNRSAIGARIEITTDVRTTVKEVSSGAGRGSFNSLPVEFGLGSATQLLDVTVRWPSGRTDTWNTLAMNQYHTLTEGGKVPAASTWALAALALAIATAGTVLINRTRNPVSTST